MTEGEVEQLYTDFGYVIFRRCHAYLGDDGAAQDAVQEVFVRALRSAAEFRNDADPRTWLCRIADHLCVDWLRRRRANPVRLLTANEQDADDDAGVPTGDDPQEHAELARDAHRLMGALDATSQRLAVLYYVDELTQDEVAAELGLSRRTIGKRLRQLAARARSLLSHPEVS
jgi:RNA polymerase sigma factor (sigma-70 family)